MNILNWLKPTPTIAQIHADFFSAGESLLRDANKILDTSVIEKANLLNSVGFTKAQGVERGREAHQRQKIAALIYKYSIRYPTHKFITEGKVNELCKKYGLIHGPVSNYIGDVPLDKLKQIISFKGVNDEDVALVITGENWRRGRVSILSKEGRSTYEDMSDIGFDDINDKYRAFIKRGGAAYLSSATGALEYDGDNFARIRGKRELMIVAPKKDFDLKDMNVSGYKAVKNIPDPIVLAPIRGGYLILAAWGDEASDPIVVNERFN